MAEVVVHVHVCIDRQKGYVTCMLCSYVCRKTKWSRSSRTDKGVHSLATVIGLRVLMQDEDYDTGKG